LQGNLYILLLLTNIQKLCYGALGGKNDAISRGRELQNRFGHQQER